MRVGHPATSGGGLSVKEVGEGPMRLTIRENYLGQEVYYGVGFVIDIGSGGPFQLLNQEYWAYADDPPEPLEGLIIREITDLTTVSSPYEVTYCRNCGDFVDWLEGNNGEPNFQVASWSSVASGRYSGIPSSISSTSWDEWIPFIGSRKVGSVREPFHGGVMLKYDTSSTQEMWVFDYTLAAFDPGDIVVYGKAIDPHASPNSFLGGDYERLLPESPASLSGHTIWIAVRSTPEELPGDLSEICGEESMASLDLASHVS